MKSTVKILACTVAIMVCGTLAFATPSMGVGGYTQNFDSMGTAGTTAPDGYSMGYISGGNTTYGLTGSGNNSAGPITAAGVASTTAFTATVVPWDLTTNGLQKNETNAFNCGSTAGGADRSLGTDPTGDAANVLQLVLTNGTGASLSSVSFAYDQKCLSLGTAQNGGDLNDGGGNDEGNDLPGYAFFYSTDGSTWTSAPALYTTGWTVGGVQHASATITFGTSVAAGASMYFRWADDNGYYISPDQMNAIDNVAVAPTPEPATMSLLVLGGLAMLKRRFAA